MKQKKHHVEPVEAAPAKSGTDPRFPANWGERAAPGILSAVAPRIERTTPDFLGVVRDARKSKYAVTLDAFPSENPGTTQDVRVEDLEPHDTGDDHPTWPRGVPGARLPSDDRHPPSNETIDELIDGLPLDIQPQQRKRSDRRGGGGEARAKRVPLPRLTLPDTSDVAMARAQRDPKAHGGAGFRSRRDRIGWGATLIPQRFRRGPGAVLAGAALLVALVVVAFVVVRVAKSNAVAESYRAPITTTVALSVAIQPPPAPRTEPAVVSDRASVPVAMTPVARTLAEAAAMSARAHAPSGAGAGPSGPVAAGPAALGPAAGSSGGKRAPRERPADLPGRPRGDELETDVGAMSATELLTGH